MANDYPVIRFGRLLRALNGNARRVFTPDEAERSLELLDRDAPKFLTAAVKAIEGCHSAQVLTNATMSTKDFEDAALARARAAPSFGPIYDFDEMVVNCDGHCFRVRVGVTVCEKKDEFGFKSSADNEAYSKVWVRSCLISVRGKPAEGMNPDQLWAFKRLAEDISARIIDAQVKLYGAVLREAVSGPALRIEATHDAITLLALSNNTVEFDDLYSNAIRSVPLKNQILDNSAADGLWKLMPLAFAGEEAESPAVLARRPGVSLIPYEDAHRYKGLFLRRLSTPADGAGRLLSFVGYARSPFVAPGQKMEELLKGEKLADHARVNHAAVAVTAGLAAEVGADL